MPIALLIQAASAIPALAKFFGAPDTAQKVADEVGAIATSIGGGTTPEESIKNILGNQEKLQQFQLACNDQMMRWDGLYLADVANARDRDVKLAQAGFRNLRANWLAAIALALVILTLLIVVWDSSIDEFAKGVITLILGRALGWVEQIFSFEFGTTKQSKAKDETIASLSKGDKNG